MASKNAMFVTLAVAISLVSVNSSLADSDLPNGQQLPFLDRMLSSDPNADPICLRGFRNVNGRRLCCVAGCRKCGGKGCNRGGVGDFCCGGRISRSGRSCDTVGAPCIPSRAFPIPDPTCRTGLFKRGICCPAGCRFCGGARCGERTPSGAPDRACCLRPWRSGRRSCDTVGPPCLVSPENRPRPSPSPSPGRSRWVTITDDLRGKPTPRHEACMAWVDGKGYLVGGRGLQAVDIFDPASGTWTEGTGPGIVMHHMQCVGWGGKVWVVSSWTGGFPREVNNEDIWVYTVATDSWSTKPGLPERRLRGGAASIVYDDKVYVIGGNRGGHGEHAMTLGWMDYYDLTTEEWTTDLPDLPEGRDHVAGALVNGDKLCIAGGRDGGVAEFFLATITSTYCYKLSTGRWSNMEAEFPAGRGGAMAVTTCDGHMMIAGGERLRGPAFDQVDVFNGVSWRTTTKMNRGRHGGGLAVTDCSCGKIFVASGAGNRGGGPELDSTEMYLPDGIDDTCTSF